MSFGHSPRLKKNDATTQTYTYSHTQSAISSDGDIVATMEVVQSMVDTATLEAVFGTNIVYDDEGHVASTEVMSQVSCRPSTDHLPRFPPMRLYGVVNCHTTKASEK